MAVTRAAPRLRVELVPKPLWYRNVRSQHPADWRRLRRWALDRAGNRCQICGHHVDGGRNLVCHEIWVYDDTAGIQTLTGVEIHCRACDAVTHLGHTIQAVGWFGARPALSRLRELNGWDSRQAMTYVQAAFAVFRERSGREWRQDIGWFERWMTDPGSV
jgi:hypothetical protein